VLANFEPFGIIDLPAKSGLFPDTPPTRESTFKNLNDPQILLDNYLHRLGVTGCAGAEPLLLVR
jgi:hypothetical protein